MAAKTRLLVSNAGLLAGALLGSAAGFFGFAVGLTLGFLVDTVRAELGLRTYLTEAGAATPDEVIPGLLASLALATTFGEGLSGPLRQATLSELLATALVSTSPLQRILHRPWPGSILALLKDEDRVDASLLGRRLALEGSASARFLLAEAAWAFEARRGELRWEREVEITTRLLEAGLEVERINLARARFFPDWKSPWEVLGLAPGAPPEDVKMAFRKLSKRWHPDQAGEPGGERFREAKAAYELLLSRETPASSLGPSGRER